jgi:hypothetical protein
MIMVVHCGDTHTQFGSLFGVDLKDYEYNYRLILISLLHMHQQSFVGCNKGQKNKNYAIRRKMFVVAV